MTVFNSSEIERLVCEKSFVQCTRTISEANLHAIGSTARLCAFLEEETRELVLTMTETLPAVLKERISIHKQWPKTWWDAFKVRWFPNWMLRRWPAEWERLDIDQPLYAAVCPHLDLSGLKEQSTHVMWLLDQQRKSP